MTLAAGALLFTATAAGWAGLTYMASCWATNRWRERQQLGPLRAEPELLVLRLRRMCLMTRPPRNRPSAPRVSE